MSEDGNSGVDSGSDHSVAFKVDGCGHPRVFSVPPKFCSAAIKLAALQIHLLGVKNPLLKSMEIKHVGQKSVVVHFCLVVYKLPNKIC